MSFENGFYLMVTTAIVLLILLLRALQRNGLVKEIARQKSEAFTEQATALRAERDAYLGEKIVLGEDLAAQKTQGENLLQKLQDQSGELERLQQYFKKEFENLAGRLLDENSAKFTKQNQSNIEGLLKPLHERIREFEKKVEDTYNREARERFSLQKELQRMYDLNQTLSEQANNLTAALKTDTRKQGNWGEFLLERILEVSGLESGVHYKKQLSVGDGEGTTRRPDVVILLPENRHVVVDAKVSLTAYERYFASTDEAEQQRALKDHLRSVRSHIDELSRKSYERLFDGSPDFVLMFIPVEPAYGLAIMQDNNLFSDAFRKKVILVSVSSLLATLRIIDALWRLEKQNRNAAEIIRQGGQLYDKFVGFVEDMQSLGVKLKGAQYEFGQAFGKLTEGRGNLVRKAEQMKSLGLDTRKRLPDTLTENALDPGAD
ncbi:MAG TPA: DNA recombination protein RmuC [Chitinophagaceae bacterium]|nr:DNA recombination protein RmuC [Chitinophagaceae bacterium]